VIDHEDVGFLARFVGSTRKQDTIARLPAARCRSLAAAPFDFLCAPAMHRPTVQGSGCHRPATIVFDPPLRSEDAPGVVRREAGRALIPASP
jgi:hypothetical protein